MVIPGHVSRPDMDGLVGAITNQGSFHLERDSRSGLSP